MDTVADRAAPSTTRQRPHQIFSDRAWDAPPLHVVWADDESRECGAPGCAAEGDVSEWSGNLEKWESCSGCGVRGPHGPGDIREHWRDDREGEHCEDSG